ncbi:MAG: DUF342 domain-containing protein [Candidatus Hydrogenedentes bacterium]|nr:DUF342 domain-containing protein [Candidatus Hydrogenedentota bacterium]
MTNALSELTVRVTADHMAVIVDGSVSSEGLYAAVEFILQEMERLAIVNRPAHDIVEMRIRIAMASGKPLTGLVLCEGRQATQPVHGRIEWLGEFFAEGFAIDERTGAIDYRHPLAQLGVHEGQPLARLVSPIDGVEGVDVHGRRLLAAKGKAPRIAAGKNVRLDTNDSIFYATANGRIRWRDNTLSVDDVYSITGSVGLETGDIDHPGALLIKEDICSGSHVTATGDIEVHGVIEGANVESGGDLIVHGGITNGPDNHVRAAGTIHAHYVLEARIEAGGNIEVDREIVHSEVVSHGSVITPRGRIVGGQTTAVDEIVLGQAGSESLMPTHLTATGDTHTAHEIAIREQRVAELEERLGQIHHAIDPLISRQDGLPEHKRHAVEQLIEKGLEIEKTISGLSNEIEELQRKFAARVKPSIRINEKVFPNCVLTIGAATMTVEDSLLGPMQATADHGAVKLSSAD